MVSVLCIRMVGEIPLKATVVREEVHINSNINIAGQLVLASPQPGKHALEKGPFALRAFQGVKVSSICLS